MKKMIGMLITLTIAFILSNSVYASPEDLSDTGTLSCISLDDAISTINLSATIEQGEVTKITINGKDYGRKWKSVHFNMSEKRITLDAKEQCIFEAGSCVRIKLSVKARQGYDDFNGTMKFILKESLLGLRTGVLRTSAAICDFRPI